MGVNLDVGAGRWMMHSTPEGALNGRLWITIRCWIDGADDGDGPLALDVGEIISIWTVDSLLGVE